MDSSGKVAWLGDKVIERDYELSARREWLGKWNPEAFDLNKVKRALDSDNFWRPFPIKMGFQIGQVTRT